MLLSASFKNLALALSLLLSTSDAATAAPNAPSTFTSCISGTSDVTVVSPGSSNYASASTAFNRRLTYSPAAIVYPTTPQAISKIVTCAHSNGLSVSARSGGHSYAAYGLGGKNGALVIDMSKMKSLKLRTDGSGIVDVQTGNRLGDVAQGIWNQGKRALPHGTCPYVGTGGHTSYGGYGPFSRKEGLLLDHLVSADVVLANGTLVTASSSKNSDLFFALRGAAPSYAIVVKWAYRTVPAPSTLINFSIDFPASVYRSHASLTSLLTAFDSFNHGIRNEMWMNIALGNNGDGGGNDSGGKSGVFVQMQGLYVGPKSDWNTAIAPLLKQLPKGYTVKSTTNDWIGSLKALDGPLGTSAPDMTDTFFAKSMFSTAPFSSTTWASFVKYLSTSGTTTSLEWFAEIDVWGGAISNVAPDATSFAHRNAHLSFQLYASSPNYKPPYPSNGISFVNNMLSSINTNVKDAYPNYIDPTLSATQWPSQYFGSNYARLQTIKKKYDPNNEFSFPQSITLP